MGTLLMSNKISRYLWGVMFFHLMFLFNFFVTAAKSWYQETLDVRDAWNEKHTRSRSRSRNCLSDNNLRREAEAEEFRKLQLKYFKKKDRQW